MAERRRGSGAGRGAMTQSGSTEHVDEAILGAIPDIILRIRRDGLVLDARYPPGVADLASESWGQRNLRDLLPQANLGDALALIGRVLSSGKPLLIFPEGTRSETGVLKEFKAGGFYAAVRAGVPVVPVALDGTYDLMMKGALDTGEGNVRHVKVRVGAPISPLSSGKEAKRVADLRDRAQVAVGDLLRSIGGRVEPFGAPGGEARVPLEPSAEAAE